MELGKELDAAIYKHVTALSDQGNDYLGRSQWDKAIKVFREALNLLPLPKHQWEAALWLNASIGDAYFSKKDFSNAKDAFLDALNCPDAQANPFVQLRLGETLYELNDKERAKENLLRAYMLESDGIFAEEDPKYLSFLKQQVDLSPDA